jgi:hypothetical protein
MGHAAMLLNQVQQIGSFEVLGLRESLWYSQEAWDKMDERSFEIG